MASEVIRLTPALSMREGVFVFVIVNVNVNDSSCGVALLHWFAEATHHVGSTDCKFPVPVSVNVILIFGACNDSHEVAVLLYEERLSWFADSP